MDTEGIQYILGQFDNKFYILKLTVHPFNFQIWVKKSAYLNNEDILRKQKQTNKQTKTPVILGSRANLAHRINTHFAYSWNFAVYLLGLPHSSNLNAGGNLNDQTHFNSLSAMPCCCNIFYYLYSG